MTDYIIIFFLILFFCFSIFEQYLIPQKYGENLLIVPLMRRHKIDGLLTTGIFLLVIYFNFISLKPLTLFLIGILIICSIYYTFLRQPYLYFKPHGFIYSNVFIDYSRVTNVKLNEKGVLIICLTSKTLYIYLNNIDDSIKILNTIKQQHKG